jgi:glycosyltransferase involved in cell wall biosynthesis
MSKQAVSEFRKPIPQRGPLRVMFMLTSMPVGGAETLLVNLVRRLDRRQFQPMICCLKERGPLGEELATELPVFQELIGGKFDLRVVGRLKRLMQDHQVDALITVGAGDKMFWGRIAARRAGLPVIASALHSTGWPDGVGKLNRLLTPITDAFIAVATEHGRYLREVEGFPADKVAIISNGIDTLRFRLNATARQQIRQQLQIAPKAPVCGIVAALRPEKDHALFLRAAEKTLRNLPQARFIIAGDGPLRADLERLAGELQVSHAVNFLGSRSDIPELLSAMDLFTLTSQNEASPVSILEAMSIGLPIVAPRVGSIPETVEQQVSGFLIEPGQEDLFAEHWRQLLADPQLALRMGDQGKRFVQQHRSLESMVEGYERLILSIYQRKCGGDTVSAQFGSLTFPQVETQASTEVAR